MDTLRKEKLVTSVLRFNFTDEIIDAITQFAKLHQFDDRHTYRENWDKWVEENNCIIVREIERLQETGYDGDVADKMFKAGRYYFRKKNNNIRNDNDKKKRKYISLDKIILDEMDKHIVASIGRASIGRASIGPASIGPASISRASIGPAYTPANGYAEFCKLHENLLNIEKIRIELQYSDKLLDKFKKTYKNRYFMLTK